MHPSLELGTVIQNRYRILSVLGQGGFGRTYLAEDQARFSERCAIKELTPPAAGEYALKKSQDLFQREAQVLYKLRHPQVPQFHATFEQDGRFFIVQDYVDGKTYRMLLDQLKSQGYVFSEAEVVQLMQQILPTLTYLHGQGIIHRDISPDNVILRARDRLPVLIDFGVVKELATKFQQSTQQATSVGKVGFAPIEQMQTGRAYPNSDLYALAVTVIVLLSGREPQELLDDRTMTWHWQRWAQVTPGLAHVLTRMLSYAPGDRYSSADEVAHALETMNQPGAVQGVPQPAPPPAPPERTVAAVGKPPSQMATVAAVGNRERPANRDDYNDDYRPGQSVPPRQSSLWDDPFAVISVGLGLMVIAGIGTWAAFNAITRSPKPAPEPTPIASIEPSPSPSATPTPKPSPSPMVYSQRLNLKAGESATRNELLKQGDTLNLTFDGEEGQTLDAKITGEGVLMTVIAPNGNPVSESAKRVSAWQGELPFTGQYTLQMRPVQGLEKGDLKLDASLKAKPIATPTPTPTPAATPTPSPTDSPDPDPDATTQTQRVLIAPGQTATTIPGQASAKVTQRYLVKARGGQSLKVAVSGGAKLTLRYPDGSPIEDATGIIEYSGQLPDNGDYMIDVSSGSPTDFQLNVEVQ